MTVKRLRRLVATLALVTFIPGGASAALAQSEAASRSGAESRAQDATNSAVARRRQRRVEDGWVAEQRHAAWGRRRGS